MTLKVPLSVGSNQRQMTHMVKHNIASVLCIQYDPMMFSTDEKQHIIDVCGHVDPHKYPTSFLPLSGHGAKVQCTCKVCLSLLIRITMRKCPGKPPYYMYHDS